MKIICTNVWSQSYARDKIEFQIPLPVLQITSEEELTCGGFSAATTSDFQK